MFSKYVEYFQTMMHNPVYGSMVTLWVTGSIAWLLRNVPYKIYSFIKKQITTSLVITDAGYSNITQHYNSLLKWILNQKGMPYFCRNFTMKGSGDWWSENNDKFSLGLGYGTCFFIYKKRLCWINQSRLNSSGSEKEKTEITITSLTRNKKIIEEMVDEFRYKRKKNEIYVNRYSVDGWDVACPIIKRPLKTVIINKTLKEKILSNIDYFIKNKDWFIDRGLPYKKTIVFSGPPGTGKTSFIKTIASEFDKSVYVINISQLGDSTFEKAITTVPANSIIIIEDFDSCEATHSRIEKDDNEDNTEKEKDKAISLTTILNTLDGIISLNGTIIFMTTNHIEKIDSALLRKGRVDEIYEIPLLKTEEIREYISLMFPEEKIDDTVYKDISGCDLQSIFMESRGDYNLFIKDLQKQ